jgi:heme oxygenase
MVDHAFGSLGLNDHAHYARFLTAHARALPVAEAWMCALPFARTLAPRTPLLAQDLAALGLAMPAPVPLEDADDDAARWGVLYVVEGSRLGGAMLARAVPAGLPGAYLGAVHPPGQWRTIRAAIDAAGDGQDADWGERLVAGALACFDLYARAAG